MDATFLIFGIFALQVVVDVIEDTMKLKKKDLHFIQLVHLTIWVSFVGIALSGMIQNNALNPDIKDRLILFSMVVGSYFAVRFAIFDILWNIINGQSINYYGITGRYAKAMNYLNNKIAGYSLIVIVLRVLFLFLAIYYFNNLFLIKI